MSQMQNDRKNRPDSLEAVRGSVVDKENEKVRSVGQLPFGRFFTAMISESRSGTEKNGESSVNMRNDRLPAVETSDAESEAESECAISFQHKSEKNK